MQPIPDLNEVLKDYPEFTGIHPIATVFPMKPETEFWELVEHIRENGVSEKLLREKGTGLLVDGRNRLLAVSITRSLFEIEDVDSDMILPRIVALNFHAKKFDASQRATIAHELRPFYDEQAQRRMLAGKKIESNDPVEKIPQGIGHPVEKIPQGSFEQSKSRDEAGKAVGVNGKYVDMAGDVALVDRELFACRARFT
jgi:hypothetical protein